MRQKAGGKRYVRERSCGKENAFSSGAKRTGSDDPASKNQDLVRQFAWAIASIDVHLQEIRYFWAKTLGISGPQWMILMALAGSIGTQVSSGCIRLTNEEVADLYSRVNVAAG